MSETTKVTKTMTYVIDDGNSKKTEMKEVKVPLTDDDKINARIKALRLLVVTGEATDQDKQDLQLLTQ